MGSTFSTSGFSTPPFGAPGDEKRVRLKLSDIRGIKLKAEECFYGVVGAGLSSSDIAPVRRGSPIEFDVSGDMVLLIEFRTASPGGSNTRTVGTVRMPLEHMSKRFGQNLYHMWFPLDPSISSQKGDSQASQNEMNEQFDRALRNAPRDPQWPLVCLSLGLADFPEAVNDAAPQMKQVKLLCFEGVLQSHIQHSRLLQTLYRHVRALKPMGPRAQMERYSCESETHVPSGPLYTRSTSSSNWVPFQLPRENTFDVCKPFQLQRQNTFDVGNDIFSLSGRDSCQGNQWRSLVQLRTEIESTTAEAHSRISQANDSVRTLKDRLAVRQKDCNEFQQKILSLTQQTNVLEMENERLACQLQSDRGTATMTMREHEEEENKHRQEADMLREQNEALVLILEDLYGAVQKNSSTRQSKPDALIFEGGQTDGWTNMLPSPSDLLV